MSVPTSNLCCIAASSSNPGAESNLRDGGAAILSSRPLSIARVIRAKCLDCSGGSRADVKSCFNKSCALYEHRLPKTGRASVKAVQRYCHFCNNSVKGQTQFCTAAGCPFYRYRLGGINKTSAYDLKYPHLERNASCKSMVREKKTPQGITPFSRQVVKMVIKGVKCRHCGSYAETIHHKDENHYNNRKRNLVPVCHKCHIEATHPVIDKRGTESFRIESSIPEKPSRPLNLPPQDWEIERDAITRAMCQRGFVVAKCEFPQRHDVLNCLGCYLREVCLEAKRDH